MSTDTKPKGPASYFPFIEKTYGQPVAHWFGLLAGKKGLKYMELVSFLKSGTAWAMATPTRWWHTTWPERGNQRPAEGRAGRIQLNDFICNCHADRV